MLQQITNEDEKIVYMNVLKKFVWMKREYKEKRKKEKRKTIRNSKESTNQIRIYIHMQLHLITKLFNYINLQCAACA